LNNNSKSYTLGYLAEYVGAELTGSRDCVITHVATLESANEGKISFLANPAYRKQLSKTQASAVLLLKSDLPECKTNALVVENPYYAYARIAKLFENIPLANPGIHPSAVISNTATLHPTCSIGPFCYIGDDVSVGEGSVIGPNCVIDNSVKIGKQVHLWSHVTLYFQTEIGDRVVIHSGAVIGADGFGFAFERGSWHKVPQLGKVSIAADVDIGANTAIDRGALGDTIIEQGVKIDNLVQIAHNVRIGAHTVIAGCVGIAGSTVIGKYCAIGGASCIGGHLTITDKVQFTGMSMVTGSITKPGIYSSGTGIEPNLSWRKNAARFRGLDELFRQVQRIDKQFSKDKEEL